MIQVGTLGENEFEVMRKDSNFKSIIRYSLVYTRYVQM